MCYRLFTEIWNNFLHFIGKYVKFQIYPIMIYILYSLTFVQYSCTIIFQIQIRDHSEIMSFLVELYCQLINTKFLLQLLTSISRPNKYEQIFIEKLQMYSLVQMLLLLADVYAADIPLSQAVSLPLYFISWKDILDKSFKKGVSWVVHYKLRWSWYQWDEQAKEDNSFGWRKIVKQNEEGLGHIVTDNSRLHIALIVFWCIF